MGQLTFVVERRNVCPSPLPPMDPVLLFSPNAYNCRDEVIGTSAAFSFLRELTDDGWIAADCRGPSRRQDPVSLERNKRECLTLSWIVRYVFSLILMAKFGATAVAIKADSSGSE